MPHDLLSRIQAEIRDRLTESRAAVEEYERLEAALTALDGSTRRSRGQQARADGEEGVKARRTRRRAPRGANRSAVLAAVSERPGSTATEIRAASGVEGNTLYALLRTLVGQGELKKAELPGGHDGYSIASPKTDGTSQTSKQVADTAADDGPGDSITSD